MDDAGRILLEVEAEISEVRARLLRERLAEASASEVPAAAPGSPQWLTVKQVAQRCGVSESFVYQHQKKMPTHKVGGRLKFDAAAVDAWMQRQKAEAGHVVPRLETNR